MHVDPVVGQDEAAGAGFRRDLGRDRPHAGGQDRRHEARAVGLDQLASRIGSPVTKGVRAIEPASCWMASGRSLLRMKFGPAAAAGQTCHWMSFGDTTWPMPISALATRTSTVSIWATGCGAAAAACPPAASRAARPPAATQRRAQQYARLSYASLSTMTRCRAGPRPSMRGFHQRNVNPWLMRRIQMRVNGAYAFAEICRALECYRPPRRHPGRNPGRP